MLSVSASSAFTRQSRPQSRSAPPLWFIQQTETIADDAEDAETQSTRELNEPESAFSSCRVRPRRVDSEPI